MTEAFAATGFLGLFLMLGTVMAVGLSVDAELPRGIRWAAVALAVLVTVATIACFLAAIWWEVLA